MAQIVNLEMMENTVRRMTARYTQQQMTTQQIYNYINLAYTIHMPLSFKNSKLTKPYVFYTTPNVDTYDFVYENGLISTPAGIPIPGNIEIGPPIYCQGYILNYFQNKSNFYNRWPKLSVNQQINTGTGISAQVYTGTIPSTPFLRGQLDIQGNVTEPAAIISSYDDTGFTYTLTDVPQVGSNTGLLVDDTNFTAGLINYLTGEYTFSATIPSGAIIYASVVPYQPSRPTDVIFYNQQLTFRPVPAQVFQVEFQVSQQPTQLIANNEAPELEEWYLFICAWASKLIFTDFPDEDGMAYLQPIWDEQQQIAQRRTLRQMSSQRAQTLFSTPRRPLASWYYGTEYSGSL